MAKLHLLKLLLALCSLIALSAQAAQVSIEISPKVSAQAEYLIGAPDKPIALILHGYLSTNRFHTVKAIKNALYDEGFSVLSPTLSLGIDKRQASLKCEAIHTHTLEKDLHEIDLWIQWLKKNGHKRIVLIGHSSGSQELLAYLADHPDPVIQHLILTSLFYLNGPELGITPQTLELAKQNQQNNTFDKYSFLFCQNNYLATGESFLSYQRLTRNYVLTRLRKLQQAGIKIDVIMGSKDKRYQKVGDHWLAELAQTQANLLMIKGANHFFSDEHEFDLQERILQLMISE